MEERRSSLKSFYVYILLCGDGTYYTGQTDDLVSRLQQHYVGDTSYTATRKPAELVWQGEFETREGAIAFEQQIKGWSRAKKEALIAGDWSRIQDLARSKTKSVHPEPIEGQQRLRQASFDSAQDRRLRQAQPERVGMHAHNLTEGILQGDSVAQRRAIAKAITLLESTRADHRAQGDELLTALLPRTGPEGSLTKSRSIWKRYPR